MDLNVVMSGKAIDTDMIAQMAENNQTENRVSGDEEDKKIQEKPPTYFVRIYGAYT